ncbi:hypothetical protein HYQ46_006708 [Verticillium longisporum]|nr:hypothetical protein HYQ46_006708 [Verticillium longisporum]
MLARRLAKSVSATSSCSLGRLVVLAGVKAASPCCWGRKRSAFAAMLFFLAPDSGLLEGAGAARWPASCCRSRQHASMTTPTASVAGLLIPGPTIGSMSLKVL